MEILPMILGNAREHVQHAMTCVVANDRVAAVFAMKDVLADIDAIAARVQQGRLTGQPGRPARKTTKSDVD